MPRDKPAPLEWLPRRVEVGLVAAGALLIAVGLARTLTATVPTPGTLTQTQVIVAVGAALLAFLPGAHHFDQVRRSRIGLAVALGALVMALPFTGLGAFALKRALTSSNKETRAEAVKQMVRIGKRDFRSADLSGTDLSGVDLALGRFEHSNLSGAVLREAFMMEAKFEATDFAGADLRGANLRFAEIQHALSLDKATCDDYTTLPQGWECSEEGSIIDTGNR